MHASCRECQVEFFQRFNDTCIHIQPLKQNFKIRTTKTWIQMRANIFENGNIENGDTEIPHLLHIKCPSMWRISCFLLCFENRLAFVCTSSLSLSLIWTKLAEMYATYKVRPRGYVTIWICFTRYKCIVMQQDSWINIHEWFGCNFPTWNIRNVWRARGDGHHNEVTNKWQV